MSLHYKKDKYIVINSKEVLKNVKFSKVNDIECLGASYERLGADDYV